MKVSALTLLTLHINSLIDSRKYDGITIDDVHRAIESKRLLRFLKEVAGDDIDLSLHLDPNAYGGFEDYYETEMQRLYNVSAGNEKRKWSVSNLGLCLALAWTNEIVQQGENLEW